MSDKASNTAQEVTQQAAPGAPADDWISVKDRVPTPWDGKLFSKSVLIVDMDSRWPHVRMSELNFEDGDNGPVPTVWTGGDPTHWKPAPSLPGAAPVTQQAEGEQANVLPPTRGTDSQHDAGEQVLTDDDILDLLMFVDPAQYGLPTGPEFMGYDLKCARIIEAELARRCRAQRTNKNDNSSVIAPTTSTVSAPDALKAEAAKLAPILRGMCEGGGEERDKDIYADDYQPGDGDVFVTRAADLLDEIARTSTEQADTDTGSAA